MRKQKRLLALLAAITLLVSSIGFAEEPAEVAAEEEPVVALEGALVEEGTSELEEMAEEGVDAPGEDFAKEERGEKPAEEPVEESVEELPAEPVAEPLPAERMATELGLSIEGLAADLGVSVEELFLMDSEALGELYMRIHADEYGTMPVASSDFKTTTTWDGDLITILQEYTGTDTSVIIPDDIDVIEADVFKGMTDIREVVLPADLTTIYGGAFEGCTGLTSIEFPVNVEYIGAAFVDCVNLEEVKFQGDKLTKMSGTFKNCTSLQTISIPASIESLEYGVFEGCESLYSVDFNKSKSLTAIGTSVFSGCKSLTDIDIPDSVQTIGFGAFADCESLEDPGLSIYSDLQNIGESAFSRCTSLKSVTLPGDLSFEGWAFNDCTNLASVVFKGTGMDAIPEGMFHGCSSLKSFEFPESVTSIGMSAFEGSGLTAIAIPEHVTDIGQEAFQGCKALETVKLHSGLKSVGGFAFAETGVKSVEIPYGITEIWERMFCDCASLKTVQLPDTVTSIQYGAFEGCALLENIQLPPGLTSLEGYALSGTAIRSVTIPGGVTTISHHAFSYCKSLTTVDICDGVETIGPASFSGCDALTLMRVPSSVIDIDVSFSMNSRNITMEVASDSAALEFCKEHFIKYRVNDCLEYGHSWKYDKNGESTGVCEDCGYECPHVETFVELGSDDAKKKPIVYDRNYHVTKSSLYRTVVCVECYKTVKSEKVCSAAGILEPHEYDYEEGPNEEYMPYGPCIFCGYDPEKDTSEPCKHKNTIVWYDFDEDCSFTWVDGKTHRVTGGVTTVTECEDCDYENRMHEEVEDKPFNHTCYEEGICDLCEGSVICEHPSWKFGEVYGESVNRYCVNINDPNIHETHIVAAYRECTECGYQVTAVDEEKIIQEKHILDGSGSCKACGYSPTKPKSVSITAPVKTVDIGGTIQLSATFKPEGTSDTLLWYSSNHAVATVDSRGIVTGMGAGSAKITAKMTSGKKSKSLKITVFDPEAPKKLALPKTLAFNLGETVDLKTRLTELEPATAKLEWSSSNAEVVDVDPDSGTAVMLRSGKATVSVTGANAGGKKAKKASVKLTVTDPNAPASIVLSESGTKKLTTDDALALSYTLTPAGSSEVVWKSSNEDVARVDERGNVTPLSKGKAKITAEAVKGGAKGETIKSKALVVQVTADRYTPESIELDPSQKELKLSTRDAEPVKINAKLLPEGEKYGGLSWKIDKPGVASVDEEGNVTPLGAGKAKLKITAKKKNAKGKAVSATVTISVEDPLAPTKFSLQQGASATLYLGDALELTPVFGGADEYSGVVYKAKKKGIVEVRADEGNGAVILPLKEGSVDVVATTVKKSAAAKPKALTAKIKIKVVDPARPKGIAIEQKGSVSSLRKGESLRLTVAITAEKQGEEAESTLSWKSSNAKVALVDDDGNVYALKPGKATITVQADVKAADGKAPKDTIELTIQ